MTPRKQTRQLCNARSSIWWWLAPMLLGLAVTAQPTAQVLAAQAATEETAEEAAGEATEEAEAETEEAGSESTDSEPAESAAAEESSEMDTESASESTAGTDDGENQSDAEPAQEARQAPAEQKDDAEQDPSASAESDSEDSESARKMKSAEETASEDSPAMEEDAASIETERPVEVEPPVAEAKKPDESAGAAKEEPQKEKCIIGATATLLEKQSELKFRARVDSGAKSCSLHVEKIKIEDASKKENVAERMRENIGKVIHFEVRNGEEKTHILTSKIASYVIIKNSNKTEGKRRYKVPLTFRWKSMEKEVLVTLNDRNHMEYPLLLGRNFLRGDFLVDVELDSDD